MGRQTSPAFSPLAQTSPKCGAVKGDKQLCQNPAGYGTTHPGYGKCKWHYGNTPAGRTSGARIMIRHEAYKICKANGVDPDTVDPYQVFREELARSYAVVEYLMAQTDTEAIMWPDWQSVLLAERKHLMEVAKAMVTAGIAEKEVKIMQAQAQILGQGLRQILDGLDLTPEQKIKAPELTARVFASIEAQTVGAVPAIGSG